MCRLLFLSSNVVFIAWLKFLLSFFSTHILSYELTIKSFHCRNLICTAKALGVGCTSIGIYLLTMEFQTSQVITTIISSPSYKIFLREHYNLFNKGIKVSSSWTVKSISCAVTCHQWDYEYNPTSFLIDKKLPNFCKGMFLLPKNSRILRDLSSIFLKIWFPYNLCQFMRHTLQIYSYDCFYYNFIFIRFEKWLKL